MDVIVITETLNGIISGHRVFLLQGTDEEKSATIKRAEDVFTACAKENIPDLTVEDIEDALDNGYIYDDNGYDITFRQGEAQ